MYRQPIVFFMFSAIRFDDRFIPAESCEESFNSNIGIFKTNLDGFANNPISDAFSCAPILVLKMGFPRRDYPAGGAGLIIVTKTLDISRFGC